jgi:hypothetical protein
MKTIKMLGCLASMLVVAATAAAGDAGELIELDKKWGESVGADALAPLLADEVIAIDAEGLWGRADMLKEAEEAEPATEPYNAGDYKVRFLSDDVAVMVHSAPAPDPHWSMHVWQKIDGEWRVVATAGVPIEE